MAIELVEAAESGLDAQIANMVVMSGVALNRLAGFGWSEPKLILPMPS